MHLSPLGQNLRKGGNGRKTNMMRLLAKIKIHSERELKLTKKALWKEDLPSVLDEIFWLIYRENTPIHPSSHQERRFESNSEKDENYRYSGYISYLRNLQFELNYLNNQIFMKSSFFWTM